MDGLIYDEPEIFKILDEYPNYKISNYGRIIKIDKNKEIIGSLTKAGRQVRILNKNNEVRYILRHTLVALAFIPNPNNYPCVFHKNGDLEFNYYKNLLWGTWRESNINKRNKKILEHQKEKEEMIKLGYKQVKYKEKTYSQYLINEDGKIYSLVSNSFLKISIHYKSKRKIVEIEGKTIEVHLLVGWTFLGPPPKNLKKPTINHKNYNKNNNNYKNLEWIEKEENSRLGNGKRIMGEDKINTNLKNQEVEQICQLLVENKLSIQEIAQKFNVTRAVISSIKHKKSWKHITEKYNDLENCGGIGKYSEPENKIEVFLNQKNIFYKKQKTFNGCKYKRKLQFDFYLPEYNLCIEFQGRQHNMPLNLGNKNKPKKKIFKEFGVILKRDRIKKEYCKNNNINLLRIWSWELLNMNKIISEAIFIINIQGKYYKY